MSDELCNERHAADPPPHDVRQRRRLAWGWWFFAAAALFYLLAEHRAHLFGVLPWLILLACPLLHFFMHGQHGGRDHDGPRRGDDK